MKLREWVVERATPGFLVLARARGRAERVAELCVSFQLSVKLLQNKMKEGVLMKWA